MESEKTVFIKMLGTFSLCYQGRWVKESFFRDTRPWQMMKYLADSCGRDVPQEELVQVLWRPENCGQDVCGTMRVRLRRLRGNLAQIGLGDSRTGLVLYAQDRFFFNPDYTLETDLQRLRRFCRLAENTSLSHKRRLSACQDALSLCDGPYLERSGSAPWLEPGRRETALRFRRLTETTIKLSQQTGDLSLGAALSQRVLRMAPEDEELNTELMTFLMTNGHGAEAVMHYTQLMRMTEAAGMGTPSLSAFQHI